MSISIFCRTWWCGRLAGEDICGNRYYEDRKTRRYGKPRRWVIYKGQAEASTIPPEWHAWLHFTMLEPPISQPRYPWQKDHLPNLTGTPYAHKPKGLRGIVPEKGYKPWEPN